MKLAHVDMLLWRWAEWLGTGGGAMRGTVMARWGMPRPASPQHDAPMTHDQAREIDAMVKLLPLIERSLVRARYLRGEIVSETYLHAAQAMVRKMIRQRQRGEELDPLARDRVRRSRVRLDRGRLKPTTAASVVVD